MLNQSGMQKTAQGAAFLLKLQLSIEQLQEIGSQFDKPFELLRIELKPRCDVDRDIPDNEEQHNHHHEVDDHTERRHLSQPDKRKQ